MKLNLIVIKTLYPEALKTQYEALGITFIYHQHGNGPFHYSADPGEAVFEIYPLSTSQKEADTSTRLRFCMENLVFNIPVLEEAGWKILAQPNQSSRGMRAVVQDLDGRKVELTEEEKN